MADRLVKHWAGSLVELMVAPRDEQKVDWIE